jgi:hypothetical protein
MKSLVAFPIVPNSAWAVIVSDKLFVGDSLRELRGKQTAMPLASGGLRACPRVYHAREERHDASIKEFIHA